MTNYEEVIHALKTERAAYRDEIGDEDASDRGYLQGMSAAIGIVKNIAANQPVEKPVPRCPALSKSGYYRCEKPIHLTDDHYNSHIDWDL